VKKKKELLLLLGPGAPAEPAAVPGTPAEPAAVPAAPARPRVAIEAGPFTPGDPPD